MINMIAVEGILARDPMFKYTPKGTPVCTFEIINIYSYELQGQTIEEKYFFKIEAWGKLAEKCNSLIKGSQVEIEGRLKEVRWNDPDGKFCSRNIIIPKSVELCKLEEDIDIDDYEGVENE